MSQTTVVNCQECGRLIRTPVDACPDCDASLLDDAGGTGPGGGHARGGRQKKSVGVALLLTVLLTGVGHIYLGKVARGLGWMFAAILTGVVIAAAGPEALPYALLFPFLPAIDAYAQTEEVNRGR